MGLSRHSTLIIFKPVALPTELWYQIKIQKLVKPHYETLYLVALFYILVDLVGLEPTTPCLQSRCSSQLNYKPNNLILLVILILIY